MAITVSVEGNIGAGKSTLIEYFRRHVPLPMTVLPEPMDAWRDVGGVNLLDLYYRNRPRWAYTFQSCAALSMLRHHAMPVDTPIKLMERSLHSSQRCFGALLEREGALEPVEAALLEDWYAWNAAGPAARVDLIVYLRTEPEVAHARLVGRGRAEESAVPIDFLRSLHVVYEDWLVTGPAARRPAPVLVVDANLGRDSIVSEYRRSGSAIQSLHATAGI